MEVESKIQKLTAMKTSAILRYGLNRSPIRANFQNIPRKLRRGMAERSQSFFLSPKDHSLRRGERK